MFDDGHSTSRSTTGTTSRSTTDFALKMKMKGKKMKTAKKCDVWVDVSQAGDEEEESEEDGSVER